MEQHRQAAPEDGHPAAPDFARAVMAAVRDRDRTALADLLDPVHEADIADLLEQIDEDERRQLVALWGRHLGGEVLSELDDSLQGEVLEQLPPEQLAAAVRDLDSDDVVDLVEDLGEDRQGKVLDLLDKSRRAVVEHSLTYPEGSAGRLMQREFVMVPAHWTVGQAIDHMRTASDLPGQFYHLFLTDPKAALAGMVALGRLMASRREVALSEIADEAMHAVQTTQPERDVAYAFGQYHLISAPVIEESGRLVGVITIDDAVAILDEEAEENMHRLAGVGAESLSGKVLQTAVLRFPWLFANLLAAIAASLVIDRFAGAIEMLVALAVLMPIVASMGGNAGTQSLTVAVRALATRDLTKSNALRIIRRELLVGVANGLVFSVITAAVGFVWFGNPALGAVVGAAMAINLVAAGLSGILIPLGLARIRIDPALASGVFVTTVTDVVGFLAFLGLAALILL